ncbi:MAG TPA: diguanylate cyclase [Anaerolineae bacterium]|nr:diguanylate cyclase [Anaerolineae bacterium]
MSRRAWVYIWFVLLAGASISAVSVAASPDIPTTGWTIFLVLTAGTIITQFLGSLTPTRHSYYPHLIFHFAGILLLPPLLFMLLIILPHLVEWIRKRLQNSEILRLWCIQPFNICTHLIAGFAARGVFLALAPDRTLLAAPVSVLAALIGAIVYVILNHLLVGLVLSLARGIRLRESGVLDIANQASDLVQLYLGYVVALLWGLNPLLMLPALAPLVTVYRALKVPQLQQEAQTDSKTGLSNPRHFNERFSAELERARRFNHPLAVLMADLDLLRNINNTYGHQAGDTVLVGVGRIIRETIRDYDIAARFGGEEFCVILLEADQTVALNVADRIRQAIAAHSFEVATSPTPIPVTMSLGVACYPTDGVTTEDLIRQADVATFQAKLRGRNCVVSICDVPHSLKLDDSVPGNEQERIYAAAYIGNSRPSAAGADASDSGAPPAPKTGGESRTAPTLPPAAVNAPLLPWFVGSVIVAGLVATAAGLAWSAPLDGAALALLMGIAVLAEMFKVIVYEALSVSVSAALAFAAAVIGGVPGVAAVSGGIALAHYLRARRRQPYQTVFNWATHVLAGVVPALILHRQPALLDISNLLWLSVLTFFVGLAYYAIDTGLIAVALSLASGEAFKAIWMRQFRWLAIHYVVLCLMGLFIAVAYQTLGLPGAIVFILPPFMLRYVQKQYIERTAHSVRELERMNQELRHANREIVDASRSMRQLNDELFLTLAKIIDARDASASGHAAQVAKFATAIAAELGLPPERVEHIRQAALLHDIGKLGIPERILHKPGELTDEEYNFVKRHATLGAEFLETCQGLRHLAPYIRHHHERWDGLGYPDQLRGEQIMLEARILSMCDAVEAMASDRSYHRAQPLADIVVELRRCSGTQFDSAVVEAFGRVVERNGPQFVMNSASEVSRRPAHQSGRLKYNIGWLVPGQVAAKTAAQSAQVFERSKDNGTLNL